MKHVETIPFPEKAGIQVSLQFPNRARAPAFAGEGNYYVTFNMFIRRIYTTNFFHSGLAGVTGF